MQNIVFFGHFGEDIKTIILSYNQWGGKGWQVYVDNYFQGEIFYKDGEWQTRWDRFTMDDVQAMGERIEQNCTRIIADLLYIFLTSQPCSPDIKQII